MIGDSYAEISRVIIKKMYKINLFLDNQPNYLFGIREDKDDDE